MSHAQDVMSPGQASNQGIVLQVCLSQILTLLMSMALSREKLTAHSNVPVAFLTVCDHLFCRCSVLQLFFSKQAKGVAVS